MRKACGLARLALFVVGGLWWIKTGSKIALALWVLAWLDFVVAWTMALVFGSPAIGFGKLGKLGSPKLGSSTTGFGLGRSRRKSVTNGY